MKLLTHISLVTVMFASGLTAHAACVYPQAPQKFPNGATATKEEMLAAQASIKEYSKAVQDVYLPCLEVEKNESVAKLDQSDPKKYAADKAALEVVQAKKNNAAIDELQAVATRWSDEKRAYEAQSKK
jgi:hypothetical protein